MKLKGGKATLVNLSKATKDYPDHYVIYRDNPSTLEGPVFWLSYLAKDQLAPQKGYAPDCGGRVWNCLPHDLDRADLERPGDYRRGASCP